MEGYKHLTFDDRKDIEILHRAGHTPTEISRIIKRARSTVYRELNRGAYTYLKHDYSELSGYSADISQKIHDDNATAKGAQLKVGHDYAFVNFIEHMIIDEKYSPYAALVEIKRRGLAFSCDVCVRTLYNYIDMGCIFPNVTRESLIEKGLRKRKYDKIKPVRNKKPFGRSIEDRPKDLLKRDVCGHWEMDTVIGKRDGGGESLLVLTERKSRAEIMLKLAGKTQDAVSNALDVLERRYGSFFPQIFKTITVDNGCEFMGTDSLERSIFGGVRTTVYYCHPYNSCERGSNENANKIIRRFIPKSTRLENYTHDFIRKTQSWINNYPRRILGGKAANDILFAEMGIAL